MSFEVIFSPKSNRQIRSLDEKLKEKVKKAIIELGNDPWHKGTIKVKGYENIRRKRVGNYRILYTVDKQRSSGGKDREKERDHLQITYSCKKYESKKLISRDPEGSPLNELYRACQRNYGGYGRHHTTETKARFIDRASSVVYNRVGTANGRLR